MFFLVSLISNTTYTTILSDDILVLLHLGFATQFSSIITGIKYLSDKKYNVLWLLNSTILESKLIYSDMQIRINVIKHIKN